MTDMRIKDLAKIIEQNFGVKVKHSELYNLIYKSIESEKEK